jgi:L-2-hydroxyglutarate oxidase LhgO
MSGVVKCDYLIVGAGINGLSIALELKRRFPSSCIVVIEKEREVGLHASGRNSGVLHAGFYYTRDSLKARFTRDGNRMLKSYCRQRGLSLNECGKLVVAKDETERETLHELHERGMANGVNVEIVDSDRATEIEPNAKTFSEALYSPDTATVDPGEILRSMTSELEESGVKIYTRTAFLHHAGLNRVITSQGSFDAQKVINCSGLYADRVAKAFGFADNYTIVPFKGIYLKYGATPGPVKTNIYPVPNLKNPFLGVHYTVTVDGSVKIGPTAIPAFWRENYGGFDNFDLSEMTEILFYEAKLFLTDSFGFRSLAFEEFKKYSREYLSSLAEDMVKVVDSEKFDSWSTPGIRAQLLDRRTLELVQDFIVEGDERSVHILNAVSPAFTCAMAFAKWVVDEYIA